MGNRSYLYLTSRHGDADERREISEANNNLPRLWYILLALGETADAITDQRVFADAGTPNFAADARVALSRFRQVADALLQHPLIEHLPALPRYLRAVAAYLEECVDEQAGDDILFSANLDEYSWFYDLSSEEFVTMQQREFNTVWADINDCIRRGDHLGLERALGFENDDFTDWNQWCWSFGIGGFGDYHAYFRNCYNEPREEEFADFVPQPDPWEVARANDLGLNRRRVEQDGLFGVCRVNGIDEACEILLPAEWNAIWPADDEGASEELWVQRDDRIGLLHLPAGGPATLLLPPCLDDAWDFSDDLAVVQQNDKMGMLRRDGTWEIAPTFDELWDFSGGLAAARSGDLHGYIDRAGTWIIPARFDQCGAFSEDGSATVTEQGKQGLLRRDGSYAQPPIHDEIDHDPAIPGWRLRLGDKVGLAHPDGSAWLAIEWDDIVAQGDTPCWFAVRREKYWGLLDSTGRQCAPCQYLELAIRGTESTPPQFAVTTETGFGMIAADGRELIPARYADIDHLMPQWRANRTLTAPHLVLVQEHGDKVRLGVWNLDLPALIVPCEYQAIAAFFPDPEQPPLFLVVKEEAGQALFGILDRDGEPLFAPAFDWIIENHGIARNTDIELTRNALADLWLSGQPILAHRAADQRNLWLQADGTTLDFADKLAADYATGNLQAALDLARAYRSGNGLPQDDEQARHWLECAAGGDKPLPAAQAELAEILAETDDEAQQTRARELLETALQRAAEWPSAGYRNLFGHMLLNGHGGPADEAAAYRHFRLSADQGNPYATFNLGICLENGWGVANNPQQAMQQFSKADRRGVPDAAHRAGLLIARLAKNKGDQKRQREMEKAAECQRRELAVADSNTIGAACLALADLLQNEGVVPKHERELPDILETGAQAGNTDCIERLISLSEAADSPWHDPERAAYWRRQRDAEADAPAEKSGISRWMIFLLVVLIAFQRVRWLRYAALLALVLLLYRCM